MVNTEILLLEFSLKNHEKYLANCSISKRYIVLNELPNLYQNILNLMAMQEKNNFQKFILIDKQNDYQPLTMPYENIVKNRIMRLAEMYKINLNTKKKSKNDTRKIKKTRK